MHRSAAATTVTHLLLLLILCLYVFAYTKLHRKTCTSASYRLANIFNPTRVLEFVALAVPLGVTALLEDGQLQTFSLFATALGKTEIATHNAVLEIFWFLSSFMWAISSATQIRIAQHLGNNDVPRAKLVLRIATGAACITAVCVASFLILGENMIGHLFSNDPAVWHLTKEITLLAGLGYSALSGFYVSVATLAAQGRANVIAVSFLLGAWGVGVPASYVFAFEWDVTRGLFGVWLGLCGGYAVVTVVVIWFLLRSDWVAIGKRIHHLNAVDEGDPAAALEEPLLANEA
jgi:MATE family multidrug resistance protein